MIPGSDTAKQDIILVVAGAIAALLFFWLFSGFHPLSSADNSYGKITAERQSFDIIESFGYQAEPQSNTSFRSNSTLIDSLQVQTDFNEFYQNPLHKVLYPAFYWKTDILIEREDTGLQLGFPGAGTITLEVQLSETGELIALINNDNIKPVQEFHAEALSYAVQFNIEPAIDTIRASDHGNLFQFMLSGINYQIVDSTNLSLTEVNYLRKEAAERLAEYYLIQSNWPQHHFEVKSTELVPFEDYDGVRVTFRQTNSQVRQSSTVDIVVLPTGNLLSMEYNFENQFEPADGVGTVASAFRAMFILFAVFWIVILLFMRFRLRLIDTKAAILVAVLAGLIFPFLIFLEQLHTHIYSFGKIDFSFILPMMITVGFFAAFTSLGFFTVTAISDSITRQNWPEKLRTIDLMRVGQYFNIPVGLTFVRGISYGFIVTALWCVTLLIMPNSAITVNEAFNADTTFLPYLSEILGNLAIYFLIAQVVFQIFIGQIRSAVKSKPVLIAMPAVIFILVYPFPFDVSGLGTELITIAVAGVALGWIYCKEDFFTTFISLFVFVTFISTSGGWLINSSPDNLTFIFFIALITIGFIFGSYNIYNGKSVRELPDFVPEYVQELAKEDRIKQELQIARKVQQSFLPVRTPVIDGLDISAICKPAYETGGDYYDFITLDDGKLAITIGDVSGKGIEAAFYMTFTKGVLHALFNDFKSTIEVLSKANKLFRQNAKKGTFISLIFGIFDIHKNTFSFSRAGHNPLLYFNKKSGELCEYQPTGIAIGMADESVFRQHIIEQKIELSEGDMLILFTDGVVEAISKTNKVYGDQRLHNLIKNNHNLSSRDFIKKLEEDLKNFGEKSEQHDDMTMIVIKKRAEKALN